MDRRSEQQHHVMRNLFRMEDDSSSSSSSSDDDDITGKKKQYNIRTESDPLSVSSLQQPPSSNTTIETVIKRIQHVELEMCSVGGSIEHRLWPAATFLTSYLLSNNHHDSISSIHHHNNHHRSTISSIDPTHQRIYHNARSIIDQYQCIVANKNSKTMTTTADCTTTTEKVLKVLELGAGVGFTSLELAYHAFLNNNDIVKIHHPTVTNTKNHNTCNSISSIEFLMTDLASALPLLQRNCIRNFGSASDGTATNSNSIREQKLEWGNADDINNAIRWSKMIDEKYNDNDTEVNPLLILGTDCVYWESLHDILEVTIATLLQNASPKSICFLANVRRWKRDTHYFQSKLGHYSSNTEGRLHCICIHEQVTRKLDDNNMVCVGEETDFDNNNDDFKHQSQEREVIRIYAIQWVMKDMT